MLTTTSRPSNWLSLIIHLLWQLSPKLLLSRRRLTDSAHSESSPAKLIKQWILLSALTSRSATTAWLSFSIPMIADTVIRLSTALIAGPATQSSKACRMTGPPPRWRPSRCATTAKRSTTIPRTDVSTPNRTPAPFAAPRSHFLITTAHQCRGIHSKKPYQQYDRGVLSPLRV